MHSAFFVCDGGFECPTERGEGKRTNLSVYPSETGECPGVNIDRALMLSSQVVNANDRVVKGTIQA